MRNSDKLQMTELTCNESSCIGSGWSRTKTRTSTAQISMLIYIKHAIIPCPLYAVLD